ncbi:MAG: hypothetical protein IBX68_08360 [Dehalococcoidia bacterium]|nr:hypothetical protein [Dehalococcoidia bacterium]
MPRWMKNTQTDLRAKVEPVQGKVLAGFLEPFQLGFEYGQVAFFFTGQQLEHSLSV